MNSVFYVLAGLALVGAVLTVMVPRAHRALDMPLHTRRAEGAGRGRDARRFPDARSPDQPHRAPDTARVNIPEEET